MNQWLRVIGLLSIIGSVSAPVHSAGQASPATGYDIHVQVPHMMPDGTVGGPFHHYCKGISDQILQCLLFESTHLWGRVLFCASPYNPKSVINTGNAINASIGFSTDGTTTALFHDWLNPVQEKNAQASGDDR